MLFTKLLIACSKKTNIAVMWWKNILIKNLWWVKTLSSKRKFWELLKFLILKDGKVWDHCHITEKYRGSAYRDCNIKVELNSTNLIIFQYLKNYDSPLIMEELGKCDFKINIIPNRSEKYMSFNITNKLRFVESFQFLVLH